MPNTARREAIARQAALEAQNKRLVEDLAAAADERRASVQQVPLMDCRRPDDGTLSMGTTLVWEPP